MSDARFEDADKGFMAWLKGHVLEWATASALTLTLLQMVTPSIFDWIFDFIVVGLVWLAAKLSKRN